LLHTGKLLQMGWETAEPAWQVQHIPASLHTRIPINLLSGIHF
jgi:hypothetical protein